jgi:methylmalonyl-CoA mutase C-terminal domain/subunit
MIVQAAIQEDAHVVGISVLSGAHNALVPEVISGIKSAGMTDTLFMVGGIIPDEDFDSLKQAGTHIIFTPGTSLEEIINYIDKNAPKR